MLFHFDFANYFEMVRLAWNEKNPRARRTYLAKLLLGAARLAVPRVCFFLDGSCSRAAPHRDPHARVRGRPRAQRHTLVHRLMSEDGERFSSFRLYEMFFPSLLQKKLIRALGRFDRRWLGGLFERRALAYDEKRYGPCRAIHPTGLFEPEEDDQVLYYSMASGFWIMRMPYMGDLDFYYVDRWPEREAPATDALLRRVHPAPALPERARPDPPEQEPGVPGPARDADRDVSRRADRGARSATRTRRSRRCSS